MTEPHSADPPETTRRSWLARGGSEERFEELWGGEMDGIVETLDAIERRQCSSAGGILMDLIAARKPEEKPA